MSREEGPFLDLAPREGELEPLWVRDHIRGGFALIRSGWFDVISPVPDEDGSYQISARRADGTWTTFTGRAW